MSRDARSDRLADLDDQLRRVLQDAYPPVKPPNGFAARLMQRIEAEPLPVQATAVPRRRKPRINRHNKNRRHH